ncbi:MAG: methyltransferase domain-containing protein [Magnetococcales bacterium]|nr:methyltransferase domain-containing protein [Magnetococcales bacterium]
MTDSIPLAFYPASTLASPSRLDSLRLRRAFQRATPTMAAPDGLLAQIGQQLLDRLDDILLTPTRVLILGDRTGLLAHALQKRWPKAEIYALTLTESLARAGRQRVLPWRRRPYNLVGEADHLPLAKAQFDLVLSSMALHWSRDLPAALREIRRVLAPDRLFLFTVAGVDTLWELHAALAALDEARYGRTWERSPELPSLSGLGDLLAASGFALPVVDRDRVSLPVPDLLWLVRQLKAMGAGNHLRERPGGLLGKGYFEALGRLYAERFQKPDGTLPCTLDLLFGHAWKGAGKGETTKEQKP